MSLHDYADMVFRSTRIAAFQEAIHQIVRPGMRVLDIGTGLGTYAFFAARAGADRVTAVDSESVVHVARAMARRNGVADRIDFVHGRAPDDLPSGVYDVILFEDYPTTFLDDETHRLLEAVEARHLAEGGVLLPDAVRFCVAPVVGEAWSTDAVVPATGDRFGLDWGELRTLVANAGRKVFLPPGALSPGGQQGPSIPILPVPPPGALCAQASWQATTEPIVALALWFDLHMVDDLWVTNRPTETGEPGEPWGQWLLPLDPSLSVAPGTTVTARVWRETRSDGRAGWMGWSCEAGGRTRRGHDFAGLLVALEDLSPGPDG